MNKEKKNDLTVKIFALAIAIILWSYVMNDVNPRITKECRNVDVVFRNLEVLDRSGLVLMEPQEIKVNVKISGRRSDVLKIKDKDIVAIADLSGYSEGTKKVPIYLEVPSKVELVDYSPKEVSCTFEKIVSKEKAVTIKTNGKLPNGYSIGEAEVKPQLVFLKGPRSWVNSVSEVLAIVDISGRTSDINITVPIKLVDDGGNDVRGVEKDPNRVDIYIPVYRTKSVPIEIQTQGEFPSDVEITALSVSPSRVDIKGYGDLIGSINSIKTSPVDVKELMDKRSVDVSLMLPEGVELLNPEQKISVRLNLEKIETKTFEYNFNEINIKNLSGDLTAEIVDSYGNVAITLKGPETILNGITKESISPEIDLSGLGEGTYDVNINIREAQGVKVESISPSSIRVTLKKE
ncbi:MAG: YbbR domain-containing protein [Sporanaerobacter sp.]|jgi:YbbR domain-containing protein|uniref:CdaR family protein n=1 Tax=Sporanaerobacter sp. TaxID=2010183 RepID=UPI003A0FE6A3